jgi:uncharacterized membrane protein YkvA (DUF1232 family)
VVAIGARTLLLGITVALALGLVMVVALFALGRPRTARELVALIPNLLRLFRGLIRDPRVPRRAKILLAVAALWLASPIDLLPEFLPVLGPLDDAIVAALVLRCVLRRTGADVLTENWSGAPETLERIVRLFGSADGSYAGTRSPRRRRIRRSTTANR